MLRRNIIKLHNIALTLRCNPNLISLGQLYESKIIYHDNPIIMTLIRNGKVIIKAKRKRNLFKLNLIDPQKTITVINPFNNIKNHAIVIIKWKRPIYLISQSKRIQLWHQWLIYTSNTHLLRAAKLVDGIKLDDDKKYNLAEIFIDSNSFDISDDKEIHIQSKVETTLSNRNRYF